MMERSTIVMIGDTMKDAVTAAAASAAARPPEATLKGEWTPHGRHFRKRVRQHNTNQTGTREHPVP